MGDLGGDVERVRPGGQVVHVFGERLPASPLHALVERSAGDVLDPLHELDQILLTAGMHGCESDTAVTHDDRADTVAR